MKIDNIKKVIVDEIIDTFYNGELENKDVYMVWCCKTLHHWKGLFSTEIEDGKYFECTYNGK